MARVDACAAANRRYAMKANFAVLDGGADVGCPGLATRSTKQGAASSSTETSTGEPDFSLPPDDPNWDAYIQLLADVPAPSWASLEQSPEFNL